MSGDDIDQQQPGPTSPVIVAFVGAGISYNAGLPLFADLRKGLFAEVWRQRWLPPWSRRRMQASLALLAPEYAVSLLEQEGEDPRGYICTLLGGAEPTTEHRLLADAMLTLGARIYTPNFDQLIESAVARRNATVEVAVRRAAEGTPSPAAQLLKLHGSCPDIYVSSEDVLLRIAGPWADAFYQDCERPGAHLLVWGYQGADPDLLPLVLKGIRAAERCTWIAFIEDDFNRAKELLRDLPNTDLVYVEADSLRSLTAAQKVLDPNGTVDLHYSSRPNRTWPEYQIRRQGTVATAVGHLGGARLGRVAWAVALLGGQRSAVKQLVRSYLFDSRLAQGAALALLPPVLARRPSVSGWNALLVAADGRGASPSADQLWPRYRDCVPRLGEGAELLQVKLRMVSVMRARGRLGIAQQLLNEITPQQQADITATWRGLFLFQQAILLRLRGELEAAHSTLDSVNSETGAFVGANWSMWLQDEYCALAIERGDGAAAERHALRAHALATAYGQSRLAVSDLACRDLERSVLVGKSLRAVLIQARRCRLFARRHGVSTPIRRAWIDGACADAARQRGDRTTAEHYYRRLLGSPHLPHQLAAVVGLRVTGLAVPQIDLTSLSDDVGPSRLSAAALLLARGDAATTDVREWVESLRAGTGFTMLA